MQGEDKRSRSEGYFSVAWKPQLHMYLSWAGLLRSDTHARGVNLLGCFTEVKLYFNTSLVSQSQRRQKWWLSNLHSESNIWQRRVMLESLLLFLLGEPRAVLAHKSDDLPTCFNWGVASCEGTDLLCVALLSKHSLIKQRLEEHDKEMCQSETQPAFNIQMWTLNKGLTIDLCCFWRHDYLCQG